MARHIVVSLHCVAEGAVAIPFGWYDLVQGGFHIAADVRIGVLVHRQGSTCVLNEEIGQSNLDLWQIVLDGLVDVAGDEVASSARSRDSDILLEPLGPRCRHCCRLDWKMRKGNDPTLRPKELRRKWMTVGRLRRPQGRTKARAIGGQRPVADT